MKNKLFMLMTVGCLFFTGNIFAEWAGPYKSDWEHTYKVHEIYLVNSNIIKFSIQCGTDWLKYNVTTHDLTYITDPAQSGDRAYFILDATILGTSYFLQLHAQLLSALQNNKPIGFEFDNTNLNLQSLTIYNMVPF